MTAIAPGMRVKCIKRDSWYDLDNPEELHNGPAFGSVWVVEQVLDNPWHGAGFLLCGWPWKIFTATRFVPLNGDGEIEKLRELIKTPKKVFEAA